MFLHYVRTCYTVSVAHDLSQSSGWTRILTFFYYTMYQLWRQRTKQEGRWIQDLQQSFSDPRSGVGFIVRSSFPMPLHPSPAHGRTRRIPKAKKCTQNSEIIALIGSSNLCKSDDTDFTLTLNGIYQIINASFTSNHSHLNQD